MVVLVQAREVEDDRDALLRVVVVIAAEEQPRRVVRIVVVIVERHLQIAVVDALAQLRERTAHHLRADHVDLVRPRQQLVLRIVVIGGTAAADHVDVELSDDAIERHGGMLRVVGRAPQAVLLAGVPDEQQRSLRTRLQARRGFRHRQQRGRAGAVVIRAVVNHIGARAAVRGSAAAGHADVIVVRAERDVFILQLRIAAPHDRDDVLRRAPASRSSPR